MSDEILTLNGGEASSGAASLSGAQGAVASDADVMHRNAGPAPSTATGAIASTQAELMALGAESAGDPPLGGVVHAR